MRVKASSREGTVIAQWESPRSTDGYILQYNIRYWKAGEKQQFRQDCAFTHNDMPTMHTVYGLEPNNTYYIKVKPYIDSFYRNEIYGADL